MDEKPLLDDDDEVPNEEEKINHPLESRPSLQASPERRLEDQQNIIPNQEIPQQQQTPQQQQIPQQQQPMQQQLLLSQPQVMQLIQTLQPMNPAQRQQYMSKFPPQQQQQVMMIWQQMAQQQMRQQMPQQPQQYQQQQQQIIPQLPGLPVQQQIQPMSFPQNQQNPVQQQEQTEAQRLAQIQLQLRQKHKNLPDPYANMQKNFEQPGGCYSSCLACCGDNCGGFLQYACFCCFNPRFEIQTQTEGLVERFGRFHNVLGPGLHFVNPCTDSVNVIDLKKQTLNLAKQIALTKDNITMAIDASINYHITNSRVATYGIYNISDAIALFTKATLRNICGQMLLQELLEKKDEIKIELMKIIDEHVYIWGVEIENVFIKNMVVSGQVMQDAVSIAAQNRRYAESKVISAQADVETAKMQQQAANELSSDGAMQIRYLQILERIAVVPGTRLVFYPKTYKKQAKQAYQASQ